MRRSFPRAAAAVLVAGSLLVVAPAPPAVAATRSPGIDTSKWQGVIDWDAVAASEQVDFAIMRADKGRAYVDPTYATNLAGATAAGVVVGAYHRATPSAKTNDAREEADHFLDTARNAAGDVIPALDIEETGGLSPAELQDWVRTWLARVKARTGLRAMLYASPYFWRVRMGNSTWFAVHGYPLWIANWNVPSPDVPANDWNGQGWTFWQWTSTGHVSGITTGVDRDRFVGARIRAATIAQVVVTPAAGGAIIGDRIDCGAGGSRCDRLANPGDAITLTATPEPDATFLGWTGDCAAFATTPTCTVTASGTVGVSAVFGYTLTVASQGTGAGTVTSSPAGVACGPTCAAVFAAGSTVTLTADPDSASGFGTWGGDCAGSTPTCPVTIGGPTQVTARFDAAIWLEEDGAGTAYRWGVATDPRTLGGSYRLDHRAGASATFAFDGPSVRLLIVQGPAMGKATVAIDGVRVGMFDGYARRFEGGERRFDHLGGGAHTIAVTALGTARTAATGTRVGVDGLRFGGRTEATPTQIDGTWSHGADPAASGGGFAASDVGGARASLTFTGTGVTLRTATGPAMGRAELWVDGVLKRTIDLYAATTAFGVTRTVTGLSDARHTIRVVVLGTHRARSAGSVVMVDGWVVR